MDVMQRSKGIDILLSLIEKPKFVQEIQSEVGGSATTVEDRINELVKEKLVNEENAKDFPFKRMLQLTEKGKGIAEMVRTIEGAFKNNMSDLKYKWVIALLYTLGEVRGITRLEKLLFMLKYDLNVAIKDFFVFAPQKYGPYSEEITYATLELKKLGLVEISETVFKPFNSEQEEVRRMDFSLTEYGKETGKAIAKSINKNTEESLQSLKKFNEMDLKKLLDYVHEKHKDFVLS
jgi:DNA-binding HxlR family transcriptional regulator